jgi:hypothetical protein
VETDLKVGHFKTQKGEKQIPHLQKAPFAEFAQGKRVRDDARGADY